MNGSKRKQLAVPMVALMVCAVAFIGIGYALQSTATNTDNSIGAFDLEINLTGTNDTNLLKTGKFAIPGALIEEYSEQNNNTIHYYISETQVGQGKLITKTVGSMSLNLSYSVKITDSSGNNEITGLNTKLSVGSIENFTSGTTYTPSGSGDPVKLYISYSGDNHLALPETLLYQITFTVEKTA